MGKHLPLVLLAGVAATLFLAMAITNALARRKRRKRRAMGKYSMLQQLVSGRNHKSFEYPLPLGEVESRVLDVFWGGEYRECTITVG